MSRDNVKRVLVTSGNQAVLAAASKPENLALGQVGVFDAATNISIAAASTPREFYISVGIDETGTGLVSGTKDSAGQVIQAKNIRAYTFRPHTPARAQVLRMKGVIPDNTIEDYAFKFEFRNAKIYRHQGTNQFTQTYAILNQKYTPEAFMDEVVATVNANDQGLVVASKVVVTTKAFTVATNATSKEYASGDDVTVPGDIVIVRADGGFVAQVDFTSISLAANKTTNLNLSYYDLRQTVIIGSLVEGFTLAASIVETVEVRFEEGDGNQIRQSEFHETGLADPYVLSDSTGTARVLPYNAVGGTKYDRICFEYDQFSVAGWQEHLNNLLTEIAIPATDTVTRGALIAILDAQATPQGFDALADDAAGASVDPAVVEPTEDETAATDGIA